MKFERMQKSQGWSSQVWGRYTRYDIWSSYSILCHFGNFSDDTSYEYVNKYCHG